MTVYVFHAMNGLLVYDPLCVYTHHVLNIYVE